MNGLALQPNGYMREHVTAEAQRKLLLEHTDMLRVSLAGNLRSFPLEDHTGRQVTGVALIRTEIAKPKNLCCVLKHRCGLQAHCNSEPYFEP